MPREWFARPDTNHEDEPKTVSFSPEEIGLPAGTYRVKDVWSGEMFTLTDRLEFELPAHGSRLLAVSSDRPDQLLDADIRILRTARNGKTLELHFDYAAEAEFIFASKPARITLDGKAVPVDGPVVRTAVGEHGVMEVEFA